MVLLFRFALNVLYEKLLCSVNEARDVYAPVWTDSLLDDVIVINARPVLVQCVDDVNGSVISRVGTSAPLKIMSVPVQHMVSRPSSFSANWHNIGFIHRCSPVKTRTSLPAEVTSLSPHSYIE